MHMKKSLKPILLWPDMNEESTERIVKGDCLTITDVNCPTLTVYPAESDAPAPAVLICPGGGYDCLAYDKEGTEVAEWLHSVGYAAAVLKYRVPNRRDDALKDARQAMELIQKNSTEWNINPSWTGVLGFSAGAHLSARLSADQAETRPAFTVLIYPAYLGDDRYNLSSDLSVSEDTPPAFILQTQDDLPYIDSSIAYYLALKKQGVATELHLFPFGGHGYGLRPSDDPVAVWPDLCERWLLELAKRRTKE